MSVSDPKKPLPRYVGCKLYLKHYNLRTLRNPVATTTTTSWNDDDTFCKFHFQAKQNRLKGDFFLASTFK